MHLWKVTFKYYTGSPVEYIRTGTDSFKEVSEELIRKFREIRSLEYLGTVTVLVGENKKVF